MSRKPMLAFDLETFSGPFRAESDRACAVLGAALLDTRLEELCKRRLRKFHDELLYGHGPLSTFSARIRLALGLNWIVEDVGFDLDQIRTIRNEFAHNCDHTLSFADQSIADKCRTLRAATVFISAQEHAASVPHCRVNAEVIQECCKMFQLPRQRFELSVEMLAQHLDELPGDLSGYTGPSLRDQLWALGSNFNFKISAKGEIRSPP